MSGAISRSSPSPGIRQQYHSRWSRIWRRQVFHQERLSRPAGPLPVAVAGGRSGLPDLYSRPAWSSL